MSVSLLIDAGEKGHMQLPLEGAVRCLPPCLQSSLQWLSEVQY